jgi:thiol-disulfide isomerase/thioredoxin
LGTAVSAAPPSVESVESVESLVGRWDATVVANEVDVPFPFEIVADGASVKGSFFNGERRITSTSAHVTGDGVTFEFAQYATKLELKLSGGNIEGDYVRSRGSYPFRASRAPAAPAAVTGNVPSIDGTWIATANSRREEKAWRFIAKQTGATVEATILRIDGDTGTLSGTFRDGKFVLGHFSGARPMLLEVTPQQDGTLVLEINGKTELRAAREASAEAAAIGAPRESGRYTTMKDPSEPFRFAFPDLEGRLVSNTDDAFRGKVVLVSIGGSWCPNCHDEAPFLAALYRKYRAQGLEIVLLSFEEGAQLKNPERLRAFIANYGIEYTVLLAGEPSELEAKVPQADNLNTFPTTFILGRDGRVDAVHAGFPSPGSGKFYEEAEREITEHVERLLSSSS